MVAFIRNWLRSTGPVWHYKRIWLDAGIVTLCLTTLGWMAFSKMGFTTYVIFDEDGPIEDMQSFALAASALFSIVAASRTRILARYVAIVTACFSVIFFTREMPLCRGAAMNFCVSKTWLPIIIGAAALVLLITTIVFEYLHRGGILKAIHPRMSWPLGFVGAMLVVGQIAEKLNIMVLEEGFELYGYVTLLLSAIWLFRFALKQDVAPLRVRAKATFSKLRHAFTSH